MSMTKSFYHDEICARTEGADEREAFYDFSGDQPDETEIDWFADTRIAHDGFEEFTCMFCCEASDAPNWHRECADREDYFASH